MKCLVTGAAGFIGSAISAHLLEHDCRVVGVDSFTNYYDVGLKEANAARLAGSNFRLIRADLNSVPMQLLLDGVDLIFHQAGQPGVRTSWGENFELYTDANVAATQRLLEGARSSPTLRKFVFASSSSIYGQAERYPTMELDRPRPRSPYGVTKLAAEHLCSLYAENFGLPTVSLRYFTVYGPGQRPDMAFARFTRAAIEDREVEVYGDGEQIRDFTYIDDIVRANVLAAELPTRPGDVFNVAGGSSVSVNCVLETLRTLASRPLRVRHRSEIPGDVARTGGSIAKITKTLGWRPRVGLADGLERQFSRANTLFSGV